MTYLKSLSNNITFEDKERKNIKLSRGSDNLENILTLLNLTIHGYFSPFSRIFTSAICSASIHFRL